MAQEDVASSSSSSSSSSSPHGDNSAPNSSFPRNDTTTSSSYDGNGASIQFPFVNFFPSPIPALLEFSGLLPPSSSFSRRLYSPTSEDRTLVNASAGAAASREVSIQIISSAGDQQDSDTHSETDTAPLTPSSSSSSSSVGSSGIGIGNFDAEAGNLSEPTPSSSQQPPQNQRHDLQQLARWLEHTLPFSLLLLLVFIRQHLQGFFLTIWIAGVMFKCNNILQKQTALKGERKIVVLITITVVSILHVIGVYCWYQNDDLLYPLVMLPPKEVPQFWHAIFIIMVNDTLMRQVAMIFKCLVLMYYKNGVGHNYRRQGQMLTLVEHAILFYRTLLPTPVWYRFFLGNDYGSLFSSLTTGLYLTFKLTFVVEKVQTFYASVKALSQKEVHYGSHATSEQVKAMGDLCAICQEKMHTPILLRCKHIFCEECVSEWLERERTCPLCRAVVKPADLQSFGDGSTSLFYQLF